jgi:hypothetical protein
MLYFEFANSSTTGIIGFIPLKDLKVRYIREIIGAHRH